MVLDTDKLYYFASPYSHKNPLIKNLRYEMTIYAASELTRKGYRLLEPIAMCHEQSTKYELPSGYGFWQTRDRGFIDVCDAVMVFMLPGWETSEGVTDEISYARENDKTVYYIKVSDLIDKKEVINALY